MGVMPPTSRAPSSGWPAGWRPPLSEHVAAAGSSRVYELVWPFELAAEYLLVEEQQGGERLVLGRNPLPIHLRATVAQRSAGHFAPREHPASFERRWWDGVRAWLWAGGGGWGGP
jgi:hypothetical protein